MNTISRRQLYALGETLGTSATRREAGRTICGGGGGGGSSTSESNSTTNNTDARVVGGDASMNLSAVGNDISNSTLNLVSTDHGAVQGAFDLAKTSLTTSATANSAAMGTTKQMFDGALHQVQDAYSTAKAGDQKIVSIAGMAVIGLAAAALFFKKA